MANVFKFDDFINEIVNATYTQEWPMNKQEIGVNADDVSSDPQYAKSEGTFQQIQDQMKLILKPILMKKNKNVDDTDVEKVSNSFFNLGDARNQEIKKIVDNCKDPKQCAQDIVNKYIKYVKINFNTKDNVNDVEQDSVMASEGFNFKRNKKNPYKEENEKIFKKIYDSCEEDQKNTEGEFTPSTWIRDIDKINIEIITDFGGMSLIYSINEKHYQLSIPVKYSLNFKHRIKDFIEKNFKLLKFKNTGYTFNIWFENKILEKAESSFNGVCPECDGKGFTDKGKCKLCKGTGLWPGNKRKRTKTFEEYCGNHKL